MSGFSSLYCLICCAPRHLQAKHELNYARFFSILRARTTPYLFACLMFKHVEEMRRVAIRVMYMTYGYKKKDTPAIQDQYPLVSLVRLLCFEDAEEARTTCQHYNITVKEVDVASSSSPTGKKRMELIFWKASRFTIPKDEVKGVVIPVRPRKMLRTIESKLNGITRLAVLPWRSFWRRKHFTPDTRKVGF